MTADDDPMLQRVRAGLQWPPWEGWTNASTEKLPVSATIRRPTDAGDPVRRRDIVEASLAKARTVADGGPYLEILSDRARARLDAQRNGRAGPLGEFTLAIKDLFAIAGLRLGAGSRVRADAPAEQRTAPIVEQLEALGAVGIGTVTLHEFAFGVTGVNPYAGTADNPAAPGRITGGSSSGSAAAVADGSARVALGTDTGGSIRGPASFCGVVGFKPSFGLYPATGVFPLSATLDHVGLFATTTGDIATVHRALGHPVPDGPGPRRVGLARSDLEAADPDVAAAVAAAVERMAAAGIEVRDVEWPDSERVFVASTAIMFSEAAAIHAGSLAAHPDRYGADIRARLELGASLRGTEVAAAHRLRHELIGEVMATLADVDLILGPTTPLVAPPSSRADDPALPPRIVANTRLGNVVGLPAISVPLATSGPPVGLQLMAASDGALLAHASAIETIARPA